MGNYETKYPASIELHGDYQKYSLNFSDNQNRVLITEANSSVPELKSIFEKEGFSETILEEKKINQISQGLMKHLTVDWDMHVRFIQIHDNSIAIDAEVETSREYLEHLNGKWISVIYEVTNVLEKHGITFGIWHKQAKKYVDKILENGSLVLDNISGKIKWKPLVIGAAVGIVLGIVLGFVLKELLKK